jgi:ATP-binding cassette subfamily B (MDR/TAP) protein 1
VCKLHNTIYGLKQASRQWNIKATEMMSELGYMCSRNDPCIFYKVSEGQITIVALYVVDFLVVTNNVKEKDSLKGELKNRFEIRDLGKAKQVLGMRIRQKNAKIYVDQVCT